MERKKYPEKNAPIVSARMERKEIECMTRLLLFLAAFVYFYFMVPEITRMVR